MADAAKTTQKPDPGEGTTRVRLTAKRWLRRVPETDPAEFEVFNEGDELDITEKEFKILSSNPIRVGVVEVEESAASTPTQSNTTTNSTTTTTSS